MNTHPMHHGALLTLLARHAYRFVPGGFTLVSGLISDEYLDCKQALSQPAALPALGALLFDVLLPSVCAVGGLTMGADPLAVAASFVSASSAHPVRWFSVRKVAKQHGRRHQIEGQFTAGDTVAVVDDVSTTGGSTIEAIEKCRDAGLRVVQVVVLVDREQGGLDAIRQAAGPEVPVQALFTRSEVRDAWRAQQADTASV